MAYFMALVSPVVSNIEGKIILKQHDALVNLSTDLKLVLFVYL